MGIARSSLSEIRWFLLFFHNFLALILRSFRKKVVNEHGLPLSITAGNFAHSFLGLHGSGALWHYHAEMWLSIVVILSCAAAGGPLMTAFHHSFFCLLGWGDAGAINLIIIRHKNICLREIKRQMLSWCLLVPVRWRRRQYLRWLCCRVRRGCVVQGVQDSFKRLCIIEIQWWVSLAIVNGIVEINWSG